MCPSVKKNHIISKPCNTRNASFTATNCNAGLSEHKDEKRYLCPHVLDAISRAKRVCNSYELSRRGESEEASRHRVIIMRGRERIYEVGSTSM